MRVNKAHESISLSVKFLGGFLSLVVNFVVRSFSDFISLSHNLMSLPSCFALLNFLCALFLHFARITNSSCFDSFGLSLRTRADYGTFSDFVQTSESAVLQFDQVKM